MERNILSPLKHHRMSAAKLCEECNRPLAGRSDKRFCNDYCRNSNNNKKHASKSNCFRTTNRILRKNRDILDSFLVAQVKTIMVPKYLLKLKGFQFNFHTRSNTSKNGAVRYYCYDRGFTIDDDMVFIYRSTNQLNS